MRLVVGQEAQRNGGQRTQRGAVDIEGGVHGVDQQQVRTHARGGQAQVLQALHVAGNQQAAQGRGLADQRLFGDARQIGVGLDVAGLHHLEPVPIGARDTDDAQLRREGAGRFLAEQLFDIGVIDAGQGNAMAGRDIAFAGATAEHEQREGGEGKEGLAGEHGNFLFQRAGRPDWRRFCRVLRVPTIDYSQTVAVHGTRCT